jgi:hypothetical protein
MAAIQLEHFRSITKVSDSVLSRSEAIAAIKGATAFANRLTGRCWGHAIESSVSNGSGGAKVQVFGHGLGVATQVRLSNAGSSLLNGIKTVTAIDPDTLSIASCNISESYETGWMQPQFVTSTQAIGETVRLYPSPVVAIGEVRARVGALSSEGAYPDTTIVDPTNYFLDVDGQGMNWGGELELAPGVVSDRWKRVRGYMNPVKQRNKKTIRVTFYAGCTNGVPEDVAVAIAGIAKTMSEDQTGEFNSENYDYYSYSRLSAEEIRKLPTSAVATLLRYRVAF